MEGGPIAQPAIAKLKVRLIGDLEVAVDGTPVPLPASRKTRAIFVYLLQMRRPVRRERLCELFFDIPDDPRASLRWSLSKIRGLLGPCANALVADRERVELCSDRIVTDVDQLRHWLGGAALADGIYCHAEGARGAFGGPGRGGARQLERLARRRARRD